MFQCDQPSESSVIESADIPSLIEAARAGDGGAGDRLFALLYDEFRARAHSLLRAGPRQTLCTTELVNETWLRLHGHRLPVESRAHFCNLAARAMRQVLIDRARARQADKRGDGIVPLTLRAADEVPGEDPFEVLLLDQLLTQLQQLDPTLAEIAQLHLYGGLSVAEIAPLLGLAERTAFRRWRTARMFLVKSVGATR